MSALLAGWLIASCVVALVIAGGIPPSQDDPVHQLSREREALLNSSGGVEWLNLNHHDGVNTRG